MPILGAFETVQNGVDELVAFAAMLSGRPRMVWPEGSVKLPDHQHQPPSAADSMTPVL